MNMIMIICGVIGTVIALAPIYLLGRIHNEICNLREDISIKGK